MAAIRRRIGWELLETDATPESAYVNRRDFLRAAGVGTVGDKWFGNPPGAGLL